MPQCNSNTHYHKWIFCRHTPLVLNKTQRYAHAHQHKSTTSTGKKPMRKRLNFQRPGWLWTVSYKCEILMIVKQHLRNCFHLFLLSIGTSTVEYLEEVRGLGPHTSVDVSLKRENTHLWEGKTPTFPRLNINFIAVPFTLTNLFNLAIQKTEWLQTEKHITKQLRLHITNSRVVFDPS